MVAGLQSRQKDFDGAISIQHFLFQSKKETLVELVGLVKLVGLMGLAKIDSRRKRRKRRKIEELEKLENGFPGGTGYPGGNGERRTANGTLKTS